MARAEIGRTVEQEILLAEEKIDQYFRNIAVNAVFYMRKTAEARRVLAGEKSELIAEEAKLRGMKPMELAQQIVSLAEQDDFREITRIKAKQLLRSAKTKAEVAAVLATMGIQL